MDAIVCLCAFKVIIESMVAFLLRVHDYKKEID